MCGMLACCACTACKCDCILLPALLPIEKSNRKLEPPGRHSKFSRPVVRARKPSSLALRAARREPYRLPGRIFQFPRPAVRARKTSSLALRAVRREPYRHPGRIFQFSRPAVCVPKTNSLAFRGVVRKPGRPPGRHSQFSRPVVCVPKPNSLAFRVVVRKPGRPPGRIFQFSTARGLRIETEFISFPGSRTQTRTSAGPHFPLFPGPGFAYKNRIHWLSGELYANPDVRRAAFSSFPGPTARPQLHIEETEGARLRFLFFPIIPGFGRMLPAGRSELPCTRHRSRCRCSPLPLHWHRS